MINFLWFCLWQVSEVWDLHLKLFLGVWIGASVLKVGGYTQVIVWKCAGKRKCFWRFISMQGCFRRFEEKYFFKGTQVRPSVLRGVQVWECVFEGTLCAHKCFWPQYRGQHETSRLATAATYIDRSWLILVSMTTGCAHTCLVTLTSAWPLTSIKGSTWNLAVTYVMHCENLSSTCWILCCVRPKMHGSSWELFP